jgi:hypothetical protein
LFNLRELPVGERREAATRVPTVGLWGFGWFIVPNPAYGPALRGTIDEIFPADKRWTDPEGAD